MDRVLLIHPRKGLFQLTLCQDCGYIFGCEHCDARLTTYRGNGNKMELLCNQCQTFYTYPQICPKCSSHNLISTFGGKEKLEEIVKEHQLEDTVDVTTRIFDPNLDYSQYSKIIIVRSENLLASPDYLTQEEVFKALTELFLATSNQTSIIFDSNTDNLPIFEQLQALSSKPDLTIKDILAWHEQFLAKEAHLREQFHFPPFTNMLLLTTHEKKQTHAFDKIKAVKSEVDHIKEQLADISVGTPYPARFLKRKNMYSYHLLVRFPKQYKDFSQLRDSIMKLSEGYNIQVRLNPRHLF